MRFVTVAAIVVLALAGSARGALAQDVSVRGFAGGGATSDLNDQRYPVLGGGVLVDLGQPWVSAGAQAQTFFQWPYFTGRAAVFAQGNVLPNKPVRPFVLAGYGWGQDAGPLLGAGVEIRGPGSRAGVRVAIEDYVVKAGRFFPETRHQVAATVSVVF